MKTAWANILIGQDKKPYKVIVTDGEKVDNIPVSRTHIDKLYRLLKEIYDIPRQRVFVTEILNDSDTDNAADTKI